MIYILFIPGLCTSSKQMASRANPQKLLHHKLKAPAFIHFPMFVDDCCIMLHLSLSFCKQAAKFCQMRFDKRTRRWRVFPSKHEGLRQWMLCEAATNRLHGGPAMTAPPGTNLNFHVKKYATHNLNHGSTMFNMLQHQCSKHFQSISRQVEPLQKPLK